MNALKVANGLILNFTPATGGSADIFLAYDSSGNIVKYVSIAVNRLVAQTASVVPVYDSSGFLTASAITPTKLGYLTDVTSNIQAQLNGKQGTIALTASRAVVSDGAGALAVSAVTSTELGYVSGVTSALQTQINAKQATITGAATTIVSSNLTVNVGVFTDGSGKISTLDTLTRTIAGYLVNITSDAQAQINGKLTVVLTSPASGNVISFNGTNWVNTASSGTGIPTAGSTNQYLAKNSNTNYDVGWVTLTLGKITDVSATAAEVNKLSGLTASTTELNYITGATSAIQSQLNSKLNNSLAQNAMWIGNGSNVAVQLAAGTTGYVLTSVSGVPTWQPAPGGGSGITGPGSSTNTAVVLWSGVLGAVIQDSVVLIDSSGNITGATWTGNKIGLAYGGTNANLSGTGGAANYLKQVSVGAAVTVGTIPASDIASGAALTKTDDTNVTLTLGGTPASALLVAVSLTLGWTGTLAGARGGTGVVNTGKTITLGGNLTTSGAFNTVFTVTGSNTITFPNASITVARIDAAQTFVGKQTLTQTTTTAPLNLGGFATDSSVPVEGDIGYNLTAHKLKFYDGTQWQTGITQSSNIGKQDDLGGSNSFELLSGVTNNKQSTYFSSSVIVAWNGGFTSSNILNTVPNLCTFTIRATFVGIQTSGTAGSTGFSYVTEATFRRTATTTIRIGTNTVITSQNDTGLSFSTVPGFSTSGSNINFDRGMSATTITFNVMLKIEVTIVV